MSLRIIAGQFKGRILKTPKGSATRPTQEMVREAVFNICQNEIQEAEFLDLFAGSGSMGFEAVSRGARHATFVEKNRSAIAAIRENIVTLQIASQTTLMGFDTEIALRRMTRPFDIIYVDPPYETPAAIFVEKLLERNLLRPNGALFIEERNRSDQAPSSFSSLKSMGSRRFGETLLHHFGTTSG